MLGGGTGYDILFGAVRDDRLMAGPVTTQYAGDELYGGPGSDVIVGNERANGLFGEAGNDEIAGGDGPDHIKGDSGDDQLLGGPGSDTGNGGPDHDRCVSIEAATNCEA